VVVSDPIQEAADRQRAAFAAVVEGNSSPTDVVAGGAHICAQDAAEGWADLAVDLRNAARLAPDRGRQKALRRAARRADEIARLASKMLRDLGD
jgi:hypothetical protein